MVTVDDDTDDYAEYDEDFEELSQDEQSMAVGKEFSDTRGRKAMGDVPPRTPGRGRRPGRHAAEAAAAPQGPTISERLAAAHSEATEAPRAHTPKRRQPKQTPSRPPSALQTSRTATAMLEAAVQPSTPAERPTTSQIAPVSDKVESAHAQNSESVAVALSAVPLSGSGPRPVRGRITVSNDAETDRPNTGGSDKAKSNKPMWLQFDSAVRRQPSSGELQQLSRERPRVSSSPSSGSRTRMPPRSADTTAREDRLTSADGDGGDRKAKRLQHEIQKLTQRLKEAEGFSAEDDGLPNFRADEVDVGPMIAQGGFASVHHAFWRCTPCAMKRIFDPVITAELKADFDNEVRMLRRLRHPNIVTLMAVCRVPPHLSFLTEYLDGGSLFEMLHSPGKPGSGKDCSNETLPHILHQAASALAFMHATDVVHRDVKSHNLLLGGRGPRPPTKLCDFGLARMKSELCAGTMQWAGTPPYMAPELFEKKRYTEGVDVFAFAVLLWESAAGDIPHANLEAADIFERVKSRDCAGLPVPPSWPGALKALLRAALCPKQESRPSMADIVRQLRTFNDFPNPLEGT